ncbi:MAG TPA: nucleoside triphosphate pyrophosphohydrolase [Candidatus Micrarchaeia archaeon]|nr:nucleoside triphosphate pyrophosphohydrolase [Candidatus Micrarchaeia archaeon]
MDERTAADLRALVETVERLRAEGGCPWDRQQTHATLAPFLEEETHETVAAIEAGDERALAEELGDVLLQVAMHAVVAAERGAFDLGTVAAAADAKMVRRHPHVFGGTRLADAGAVLETWERLKAAERGDRLSLLDGVPPTLPALSLALAVQRRPARVGLDRTPTPAAARRAVAAALDHLDAVAPGPGTAADAGEEGPAAAVGTLLFAVVALARQLGVDPERALRRHAEAHRARVGRSEAGLRAGGRSATLASGAEWERAWVEAGDGPGPG